MTALEDSTWTDAYTPGDRLRSAHTGNEGAVVAVQAGRYLRVRWEQTRFRRSEVVRHHDPDGLERL